MGLERILYLGVCLMSASSSASARSSGRICLLLHLATSENLGLVGPVPGELWGEEDYLDVTMACEDRHQVQAH